MNTTSPLRQALLNHLYGPSEIRGHLALFTTYDGDKRTEPRELTAPFERVPVVLTATSDGYVNFEPFSFVGSGEVITHVGIFGDDGVLMYPLAPIAADMLEEP